MMASLSSSGLGSVPSQIRRTSENRLAFHQNFLARVLPPSLFQRQGVSFVRFDLWISFAQEELSVIPWSQRLWRAHPSACPQSPGLQVIVPFCHPTCQFPLADRPMLKFSGHTHELTLSCLLALVVPPCLVFTSPIFLSKIPSAARSLAKTMLIHWLLDRKDSWRVPRLAGRHHSRCSSPNPAGVRPTVA